MIAGGFSSIDRIHDALDTHPQMPVVVMAHSGGAASILAEARKQHKENGSKGYVSIKFKKKCSNRQSLTMKGIVIGDIIIGDISLSEYKISTFSQDREGDFN